jgi:hypothetical protein
MSCLNEKWLNYLSCQGHTIHYPEQIETDAPKKIDDEIVDNRKISHDYELSISTKTKVLFMNNDIDINKMFWDIPILDYHIAEEGVIKKQMKIVSKTMEDYEEYKKKLHGVKYYDENIIKQINNPTARSIKFKDERKITIGISKKDIISHRNKKKNAFYNCFALILRFKFDNVFREVHVKVFNTGKLEIPGIVDDKIFVKVKEIVLNIIDKYTDKSENIVPLVFIQNEHRERVLINSNFNCGFCINRDELHRIIMSDKYFV